MKLATTIADFRFYSKTKAEATALFEGTNFKYLDLSLYDPLDYFKDKNTVLKDVCDAADVAAKLGLKFVQAHAPDGEHFIPGEKRDALIHATAVCIECCAKIGIKNLVVHPAPLKDVPYSEFFKKNLEFLNAFLPVAEKYGVNILIENGPEQHAPFSFIFSSGADMKEFLEYADHPLIHAVWDTGHANMRKMDQYKSIITLGDDLYALHIADNAGERDEHMVPFTGSCNFDAIMQGLIDSDYKGYFTFESTIIKPHNGWPVSRSNWTYNGETVEKLLDAPLQIKQKAVALKYEIGKYILSQYNCFEE